MRCTYCARRGARYRSIMERSAERKAQLRKAAGDAIERAIETGGDPFELMIEATGEGDNICVPYVQQHPFFSEKRHLLRRGRIAIASATATQRRSRPSPARSSGCAASSTTIATPLIGSRM